MLFHFEIWGRSERRIQNTIGVCIPLVLNSHDCILRSNVASKKEMKDYFYLRMLKNDISFLVKTPHEFDLFQQESQMSIPGSI